MMDEARKHRLEMQRRWRAANPERMRRYRENERRRAQENPEHREKILQQKREAERLRRARLKAADARRERDRERVRKWAAVHPDRVRSRQQQWVQRNRERVREQKRAYYHRHLEQRQYVNRERNAQRRENAVELEMEQTYRAVNQERLNARVVAQRSDPAVREKRNRYQRERRQREKRRRELAMPLRPIHRSTLNQRADNAAAAESFFTRPRTDRELRKLRSERDQLRDMLTADQVIDLRRQIELTACIRAVLERPARVNAAIDTYLNSPAGTRLQEDVRMDSIGRRIRGANPYANVEVEVRRRALTKINEDRSAHTSSVAARTSRLRSPTQFSGQTTKPALRPTTQTIAR